MCYSAIVWAAFEKYAREFGADIHISDFERIYYPEEREERIKRRKTTRAMDLAAAALSPRIREFIQQEDLETIVDLEQEMFKQAKRVADGERALQSKVTKKAQEDVRIGTNKVSNAKRQIADLKRTVMEPKDSQIFPNSYAPVLIVENGRRVVKPMRYHCRPYWMPASSDITKEGTTSGKYNARRDKLDLFWKPLFAQQHGIMVATRFYENVDLPNGRSQRLEFEPRTGEPMLIACLWSQWTDPQGIEPDLYSFAAITDEPEPEVAAAGHDRTIINIRPEHVDAWLNPRGDAPAMQAILDDKQHPYYEHRKAA